MAMTMKSLKAKPLTDLQTNVPATSTRKAKAITPAMTTPTADCSAKSRS